MKRYGILSMALVAAFAVGCNSNNRTDANAETPLQVRRSARPAPRTATTKSAAVTRISSMMSRSPTWLRSSSDAWPPSAARARR